MTNIEPNTNNFFTSLFRTRADLKHKLIEMNQTQKKPQLVQAQLIYNPNHHGIKGWFNTCSLITKNQADHLYLQMTPKPNTEQLKVGSLYAKLKQMCPSSNLMLRIHFRKPTNYKAERSNQSPCSFWYYMPTAQVFGDSIRTRPLLKRNQFVSWGRTLKKWKAVPRKLMVLRLKKPKKKKTSDVH